MDNEAYTVFNITMTSMKIKYKLVPSSNYRSNNADRKIQKFKNHFIAVLCSIDKGFHLQL